MPAIDRNILIQAKPENVWAVLVDNELNKIWLREFSEETQAHTDWAEGSRVSFTDHSASGILGFIRSAKPYREMVIEYTGMVDKGQDDFDSDWAQAVKGSHEAYYLTETETGTRLDIHVSEMPDDMMEMMYAAWDRALAQWKRLAEAR